MKIRTGFVSNSSSSSFIVAFDRKPETLEELQKLLFGDDESYPNPYVFDGRDTKHWPTKMVAETVWHGMSDGPATEEKVREVFGGGYIDGEPDYNFHRDWKEFEKLTPDQRAAYWEEQNRPRDEFHQKTADEFLKEHKGKLLYTFSYADEDGSYFSALEHGTLFDRLAHFRISNH